MIIKTIAAAVVAASLLAVAPSAHAEDQRPCVSNREFYGARDFGIPLTRDPLTRVPIPEMKTVGRITLEQRWDVRHVGVNVRYLYGEGPGMGASLGTAPLVDVKMYPLCGSPLSEAQVYIEYHKDTNLVFDILLWRH